jgi:splicing factor 3A subunit 1
MSLVHSYAFILAYCEIVSFDPDSFFANGCFTIENFERGACAAFFAGVIQPPPDIKSIVDKTAGFVAKNGPQFEQRILTNERNTTKFGFLQATSPYYPYYQKKLFEARQSVGTPQFATPTQPAPVEKEEKPAGEDKAKPGAATMEAKSTVPKKRELKEPEKDVFIVLPPEGLIIPTMDMDIIKLTAQYVALNGRSFLNGLLTRESRNPQFDFLKGHHILFNYFTALVESYSRVIAPAEDTVEKLRKDAEDRVDILERAFQRLDWDAHVEKERQRQEAQVLREKESVAAIDWHDFKVVETIDFDDADEDLPPPLTETALRSLRLKASSQEETVVSAAKAVAGIGLAPQSPKRADEDDQGADMDMDEGAEDMDMDMEDGDGGDDADQGEVEDDMAQPPVDLDKPIKIVKNYVKPGAVDPNRNAAIKYMISPITGQQVPVEQMAEHMRIALLDPKWKEKSGLVKVGEREETLAENAEVGANLQRLAAKRKDIFGTDEEVFGDGAKPKPGKPGQEV